MILSILSLYEYRPDLFDQLELPADMDKDLQINTICAELAELDVLYTDPDMLKKLIGIWSSRQLDSWEKLFATTQFEYDPIANVDGTTTTERTYGKINTRRPDLTHQRTVNLTDTETPGRTVTEAVKGYNSDTWADSRKNTESGTGSIAHSGTDTYKDTGTDVSQDSGTDKETVTRKGNIGVTMTQQLIEAERDVDKFDMYLFICDAFKQQFCLQVY